VADTTDGLAGFGTATAELAEAEAAARALGWPVRAVCEAAVAQYRAQAAVPRLHHRYASEAGSSQETDDATWHGGLARTAGPQPSRRPLSACQTPGTEALRLRRHRLAPLIARANTTTGTIAFTAARFRDGLANEAIHHINGKEARK